MMEEVVRMDVMETSNWPLAVVRKARQNWHRPNLRDAGVML